MEKQAEHLGRWRKGLRLTLRRGSYITDRETLLADALAFVAELETQVCRDAAK